MDAVICFMQYQIAFGTGNGTRLFRGTKNRGRMSYQLCRWYDPYPRLAFALKLLYLAPGGLQLQSLQAMRRCLNEQWGARQTERHLHALPAYALGKRWYDVDADTARTVELLRNSPEFLKTRAADTLLEILGAEAS